SVQSSMPFVLIIFSFISVFLCLQLIIISPKINIQSSFFFIYQCLTVMLVSFTMPANGWRYVRVAEFRGSHPVRQDKDASEKFATKLLKTRQFYIAFVRGSNGLFLTFHKWNYLFWF